MNKDLKNLLQLVIKAGIEQGILGGSSRVCRKQRTKANRNGEDSFPTAEENFKKGE
ncbi:MAG: hypothetical protein Q4E42_03150 [Phascolarctobacterium sp.]|nr:hypothetical protein [Phascolarctobacterium sp.]